MMWPSVLSIAGFDGSGGAGIQADLKTVSALGCYGMNVLTALPVQNTTGVKACYSLPLRAITDQLNAIFADIIPDAIKIGMLFNAEIVLCVAEFLQKHAKTIPIVLDPVMMAKSGDALLQLDAMEALKNHLLPLCTIVTPNLPEASALTGELANSPEEMLRVCKQLLDLKIPAVLLKGGHLPNAADDVLMTQEGVMVWLQQEKIITKNTHGTGCTLSAAIAAYLALGCDLLESCQQAKNYLTNALLASSNLLIGKGSGPVHHFHHVWQVKSHE